MRAALGWIFLAVALLAAPALAQSESEDTTAVEAEVEAPAQAISVEPTARDDQIQRRIRQILDATTWYRQLRVTVDDGIVFLDGEARTDEQRAWARDLAKNTQDVVAVVNRIEVAQEVRWTFAPVAKELKSIFWSGVIALPLILLAIVILPLAWYAAKWVSRGARFLLSGRIESPFLRDVISRFIAVPVFLIGLYIVLQVAGLTKLALSLVGGAGVLGIVIGFAFRDIAENFLASLLLSIRKPFRGGDYIDVAGSQGIVQSMNTRSTVLLSVEGNHIQIPNAAVFKSTIVNYSAAPSRRQVLEVGIGYDASIARAQEVVRGVLERHEAVMNDPDPLILVDSLGSSTVNLKIYYWFNGYEYSTIKVKSALLRLIKKALIEEGISMPDDAREIIFPQGVPVLQLGAKAEETARAMAEQDIEETARAEATAEEPATSETECDLANEREEIEAQAAIARKVEGETDLLEEKV